jgi:4-deoxy-L-threo-5-hexosulose-uronate ketol-isomerase
MNTSYTIRHAVHPTDVKLYDTQRLRDSFLIDPVFRDNSIELVYSHYDRYIAGGAKPVSKPLTLETILPLKANYFLERREMGIVNVGKKGIVTADGKIIRLTIKKLFTWERALRM